MTPQFNHLLLASTLSAGLTLPLTTIAQTTQTALSVQHVDIAAGDLTGALNQLATRFGISLQFNADLTNGLSTQGITGETNLNQGFAQLLGGTGLTAIAKGDGVYVIQQVEGDMVLSPVKVQSTAKTRFGDAPAEPGGLKAEYQSTATKMAMPLKETPQAISVVTRYSMDVRQVRDVPNAIELATGVSISTAGGGVSNGPGPFSGRGQYGQRYLVRGRDESLRVDGFKLSMAEPDPVVYERIEVVKGPTGFYGNGALGGFINLVRKKPQEDFSATISGEAGSFETYRTELDVTGAIDQQKGMNGRLIVAYEDAGAFVEELESQRLVIAPSVEFEMGDKSRARLDLTYQKDRFHNSPGVPLNLVGDQIRPFDLFSNRETLYGVLGDKSETESLGMSLRFD